jgi:hypothetical protein
MKKLITISALAVLFVSQPGMAQDARHKHPRDIPRTMKDEHEEVQWKLQDAMKLPGQVGVKARALAKELEPHFIIEERIALPPIAIAQNLVDMQDVSGFQNWVIAVTDSLALVMPELKQQHIRIDEANKELARAARAAGRTEVVTLTQELTRIAALEEEVFYPIGILVGEVVRNRAARVVSMR